MEKYLAFDPYPEVLDAIKAPSGFRLAILSNGSPAILDALVKASGAAAAVGQRDHRRSCEDLQAQSEILRWSSRHCPSHGPGAFHFVQQLRHRRSQAVWLHHGLGRACGARAAEGFRTSGRGLSRTIRGRAEKLVQEAHARVSSLARFAETRSHARSMRCRPRFAI